MLTIMYSPKNILRFLLLILSFPSISYAASEEDFDPSDYPVEMTPEAQEEKAEVNEDQPSIEQIFESVKRCDTDKAIQLLEKSKKVLPIDNRFGDFTLLEIAFKQKLLKLCKKLVNEYDANPFIPNEDGNIFIHALCTSGSNKEKKTIKLMQCLEEKFGKKVRYDIENNQGRTPFDFAILYKNYQIIEHCIKKDSAIVNYQDKAMGTTGLYFAIELGDLDIVKILLKEGASLQIQDNKGNTPFHHATLISSQKTTKIIKYFLPLIKERKVNVNVQNKAKYTYLHALLLGYQGLDLCEQVKFLVEECQASLELPDGCLRTPIFVAISNEHPKKVQYEVIQYLITKGVNLFHNDVLAITPCFFSALIEDAEPSIVDLLMTETINATIKKKKQAKQEEEKKEEDVDLCILDNSQGEKISHLIACFGKNDDIIPDLMEMGMKKIMTTKIENGFTPLHYCILGNAFFEERGLQRVNMLRYFLTKVEEIKAMFLKKDKEEMFSIFLFAVLFADKKACNDLIEIATENNITGLVNSTDKNGKTVLHHIAHQSICNEMESMHIHSHLYYYELQRAYNMPSYLLGKGLDPRLKDNKEKTALDYASEEQGRKEIAKQILDYTSQNTTS